MTTYRERLAAFLQCSCMHPRSFKWCYTNKSAKQMPLARTHVSRENANFFARERKYLCEGTQSFSRERKYICERTQRFCEGTQSFSRERKYICERTQRFCEGTQSFSRERKYICERTQRFCEGTQSFSRERKYICERTQRFCEGTQSFSRERKYLCERTQRFCEGTQSFSRERKTLENIFSSYPEFVPLPCPLKGSVIIRPKKENYFLDVCKQRSVCVVNLPDSYMQKCDFELGWKAWFSMEACFRHWIKNNKGNWLLISQFWLFFSELRDITDSDIFSYSWEFIFWEHNPPPPFQNCNCDYITQFWLYKLQLQVYIQIWEKKSELRDINSQLREKKSLF